MVWLGEWDFEEPLDELLILLMLHIEDLREPKELGELGGDGCCKQTNFHLLAVFRTYHRTLYFSLPSFYRVFQVF